VEWPSTNGFLAQPKFRFSVIAGRNGIDRCGKEMHRIMIVYERGPTAAAMETCFSFGADAAFHLIGLCASEHHYHGRADDARTWNEVAMRFIPDAHREGCQRIAPWFSERTPDRVSLDEDNQGPSNAVNRKTTKHAGSAHRREVSGAMMNQPDLFDNDKPSIPLATDLLRDRYAEEHLGILRRDNPKMLARLRRSGELSIYLSGVGEDAANMERNMMYQYLNSKEVQNLPHLEQVRALQDYLQQ
jgi:hypothetical protein